MHCYYFFSTPHYYTHIRHITQNHRRPLSKHHSTTMSSLYGFSPIPAMGNQAAENQVQQSQALPMFIHTMTTARREFRPVITSYDDMRQKQALFLAQGNISGSNQEGLPRSDEERQELVNVLFNAFYNSIDIIETTESQVYKNIIVKDTYSEGAVHVTLWRLLV
jgi:hypothetical protein